MCFSCTRLLTMAGHGSVLLTQLLLFLLLLCQLMVEGFWRTPRIGRGRHEQHCVYNGRLYQNGQIVVKIPETCADMVCQRSRVALQPQEQCSCHLPEGSDLGQHIRVGPDPAFSHHRLWANHCYYNRKAKNLGETVANLSSNCMYISCQRSRSKAVLRTFLMSNCHCQDSQQPTEESTREPTSAPRTTTFTPKPSNSHIFQPRKPIITGVLRSFRHSKWIKTPTDDTTIKPRHHLGPQLLNSFNLNNLKSSIFRPQKLFSFNLSKSILFQSVNPNSVNSGNPLFFRLRHLKHQSPHSAFISLKRASSCLVYNPATSSPEAPSTSHPVEQNTLHQSEAPTSHPAESTTFQSTQSTSVHPADPDTIQSVETNTFQPTTPTTLHPTESSTPHPTEPPTLQPTEPLTLQPTEPPTLQRRKPAILKSTEPSTPQPTEPSTLHPIEPPTTQSTERPTSQQTEPTTSLSSCDYSAFDAFHSMTLEPNTNCLISRSGVTEEEKLEILRVHNNLRDKVAGGSEHQGDPGPQPSAANMQVLRWNEELASVAQAWANQCLFDHDTGDGRRICSQDYLVGQNLYYQWGNDPHSNWDRAIQQWYDEVAFVPYRYVNRYQPKASGKEIGHYVQMVWAETREVGCGAVYYLPFMGGTSRVYVCNYGPRGNLLNRPIYQKGPPTSACASGKSSQLYPHLCD